MTDQWIAVDKYISDMLMPTDPILEKVLQNNADAGLPAYDVSPAQGKMLQLLAQIHTAKTILEIGTLGGYSTIWLARALPDDGCIITLESNTKHAEVAKTNIELAGFSDIVEIRVGPASDSLAQLVAEVHTPFDMIFIDADKPNNSNYLDWALKLSRKGSVIISDNVVRNGELINQESEDANVIGIRRFYEKLSAHPNLQSVVIQTVGVKGYDGFAITIVT